MSAASDANKQLYREFVVCTLGEELNKLDLYLADDYHSHAHEGVPPGPEGERQVLAAFRNAFPDFTYDIEYLLADDSQVGCLATVSGTHEGEFMGAPASGKQFRARVADILRIANGKISEHWSVFESASMAEQLGLGSGQRSGQSGTHDKYLQLYRQFVSCITGSDLAQLEDYIAPTYFSHADEDAPSGPEGERQMVMAFKNPFPDFNYTIETLVVDGDMVACIALVTGTHVGEFMERSGTGRSFKVLTLDVNRVEDGKLAEHRGVYEEPLMLEQLGIAARRSA